MGATALPACARLDPSASAVVVVDAQNDFCHEDGLLARLGHDVGRVKAPLARLADFLPQARSLGVPVVFVQNVHDAESDTPEWVARHATEGRPQSCERGTWGAEFSGVHPLPDDVVVVKHRYSAFIGTDLGRRLEALGRRHLAFTGFTTNVCVETSLRDAVCSDFLVTLVEDCCGAYSVEAHQRTVDATRAGFGVVATSGEVLAAWTSMAASPVPTSAPGGDL